MPDVLIAPFAVRSGFTEGSVYSSGAMPTTRPGADGIDRSLVIALYGALSGRGATRTGIMYFGGAQVGLTVGASSQAQDTGWLGTSWMVAGGTPLNFGYTNLSGSCFFARSSTSGATQTQGQYGRFTGVLSMYYRYIYQPAAPAISVAPSADGTSASVNLAVIGDDGGSSLEGYTVQRALNPQFTAGVSTAYVGGPYLSTALQPGAVYYWRAALRNRVTREGGVLGGPWSATYAAGQPLPASGLSRIQTASGFVAGDAKILTPSGWAPADGRILTGAGWQPIGN